MFCSLYLRVSVDASHLLRVEHWCNIGVLSLRACSVNNCGVWGLFFLPVFSCLNRVLGWLFSLFMLSFGLGSGGKFGHVGMVVLVALYD